MDNGQEKKRPVLESTETLKGKKAGPQKRAGKVWMLVLLIAVMGGAWALYSMTDVFKTPEEPAATPPPSTIVKLIDRTKQDFDRLTVTAGGERYTLISNIEYDADGNVAATPAPTEAADETPETTPQPAPESTPAPGEEPAGPELPVIAERAIEQDYSIEGQPYFAVNTGTAATMQTNVVSLTASDTVTEDAEDLSIFGLAQPQITVEARYKDGSGHTLHFGDKTPTGYSYYLRLDDSKTVYTVGSGAFNAFSKPLNQLHTVTLPQAVNPEAVADLLIEQAGRDTVELKQLQNEKSVSISSLWLVQPIEYEAHMTRASELITAAAGLQLSGYAGHASTPEALEPFGLLQPRARIRYEDTDGNVLDMRIGGRQDDLYSYCAVDETGDVYLVETSLLGFLSDATVSHLVDQFANLVNILMVDRLTVSAGAENYVLSIDRKPVANEDGTETTEDTYLFDGQSADEKLFKSLYQEIIGLLFDKIKQDDLTPGGAVATVRYQLNNGQSDIVIEYVGYDKDYYLIRQQGREPLFLIKHEKVDSMIQACRQFRDGTYVKKN